MIYTTWCDVLDDHVQVIVANRRKGTRLIWIPLNWTNDHCFLLFRFFLDFFFDPDPDPEAGVVVEDTSLATALVLVVPLAF
jgi:hypothetical protein